MSSEDEINDKLQSNLEDAAKKLGENFDSVIIFATAEGDGHTIYFEASSGSRAASRGAVLSYHEREKGFDRASGAKKYSDFHEND
jgi:hypothetical protein